MTERRRIHSRTYFAQTMLIQNNTVGTPWFLWCGKTERIVWDGPTEQQGRDWAAANGYEIDWFEPLGSEPIMIDDEDYLEAFAT